jgi:glutaredoxin
MKTAALPRRATLYRMVMDKHVCPYGLKAKDLLQREGYEVEDRWLRTREETDAFKLAHQVKTTPQTFIGEERVGGARRELRRIRQSTHHACRRVVHCCARGVRAPCEVLHCRVGGAASPGRATRCSLR